MSIPFSSTTLNLSPNAEFIRMSSTSQEHQVISPQRTSPLPQKRLERQEPSGSSSLGLCHLWRQYKFYFFARGRRGSHRRKPGVEGQLCSGDGERDDTYTL